MKMKNSKEFREWQNDLTYLAYTYNINSAFEKEEPTDVFAQIIQAAISVPAEVERRMGQRTSESIAHFLRTSAKSLYEIYNLLGLTLSLNLISIDEYHALTNSLNEIGDIIKKFIVQFNLSHKDTDRKIKPGSPDFAYWTLN